MNTVETALQIVNLFNATAPGIASLILMIKKNDGTVSVVALLDEASQQFAANITAAEKWLKEH